MKPLKWSEEKNKKLKKTRELGFEEVARLIKKGKIVDITDHANKKYKHQHIYVINIQNYIYLVPYVEDGEKIFLKTIIPSRKATKKYLGKKQ